MQEINRVVITQPTYLPWLGYFNLLANADTFIFLDNIQFSKRSWQQRNRIKGPCGEVWLTVPVQSKGRHDQLIYQTEIDGQQWKSQHIKTIKHLYARAPFKNEIICFLSELYTRHWERLADLNIAIIHRFARFLDLKPTFYRASELHGQGKKVALLIDLCVKVGATHYLSGRSGANYIYEHNLFPEYNIKLAFQNLPYPEYSQLHGEFITHLSIIDAIMNLGWSKTRELILSVRGGGYNWPSKY